MISKKSLNKFKAIYKKEFGKDLSDEETSRKANYLLNIYRAVYGDGFSKDVDKSKDDKQTL